MPPIPEVKMIPPGDTAVVLSRPENRQLPLSEYSAEVVT
jgi:hypothetical protein